MEITGIGMLNIYTSRCTAVRKCGCTHRSRTLNVSVVFVEQKRKYTLHLPRMGQEMVAVD